MPLVWTEDDKAKPTTAGDYLTYWCGDSGGYDVNYFDGTEWVPRPYQKPVMYWAKIENGPLFPYAG